MAFTIITVLFASLIKHTTLSILLLLVNRTCSNRFQLPLSFLAGVFGMNATDRKDGLTTLNREMEIMCQFLQLQNLSEL